MLHITPDHSIDSREIEIKAIRASGPGGQNVNKVSTAIQLRFNIPASSLSFECKERLMSLRDRRITKDGTLVIKAQRFRHRERNLEDALEQLKTFIKKGLIPPPPERRPTRPSPASRRRRLEEKRKRSRVKKLRGRILPDNQP